MVTLLSFAVPAAFFHQLLFGKGVFLGIDFMLIHLPFRRFIERAIQMGEVPLWIPDVGMGLPFLANGDASVFYPLQFPFFLMDDARAIGWILWLHTGLSILTMYLLCRVSLRIHPIGAFVGGIIYALGGYPLVHSGFLGYIYIHPWIPLLFFSLERTIHRGLAWALLGSASVALVIFVGNPQHLYLAGVWIPLFVLAMFMREPSARRAARVVLGPAIALVLGVGIGAVQFLPQLELLQLGQRGGRGLSFNEATFGPMDFEIWRRFVLPDYSSSYYGENGAWIGLAASVLFLCGVVALALPKGRKGGRWELVAWLVIAGVSATLALGDQTPLYRIYFEAVPGANRFRFPLRWLFPASIALSALAAHGAGALFGDLKQKATPRLRSLAANSSLVVVSAVALAWIASLPARLEFGEVLVAVSFVALGLVVFAAAVRALGAHRLLAGGLVCAAVAGELFAASSFLELNHPKPSDVYSKKAALAQYAAAHPMERILPVTRPNQEAWMVSPRILGGNAALLGGVTSVTAFGGNWPPALLVPLNQRFIADLVEGRVAAKDRTDLIELLGTGYVLAEESQANIDSSGWRTAAVDGNLILLEMPNPGTRVRTYCGVRTFPDQSAVVEYVLGDSFSNQVLAIADQADEAQPDALSDPCGSASITNEGPNLVEIEATMPASGWLLLADTFYPGWNATVRGKAAKIHRANAFFRAVEVPAGRSRVTFSYEPDSFGAGLAVSMATFLVVLGFAAMVWLRNARQKRETG